MREIVTEICSTRNLVKLYWQTETEREFIKSAPYRLRIAGCTYNFFSNGNHNLAYRSVDEHWVFKRVIDSQVDTTDSPERCVRLWNLINPNFPARVVYEQKKAIGWVAPFIRGTRPTQTEIIKKLFEIYEKTGRIVVDAFVTANFIKTADGSVVCIDLGFALQLEKRIGRQQSTESLNFWDSCRMSRVYCCAFSDYERNESSLIPVVQATKALLYLQAHRPDFRHVSSLHLNEVFIEQLAAGYDNNNEPRHPNSIQVISNLDTQLLSYYSFESSYVAAAQTSGGNDDDTVTLRSSRCSPGFFVEVSSARLPDDVQSAHDDATLPVARRPFNLELFALHFAQIKKPKSWLDRLAGCTTAAWCNRLF